MSPPGLPLAPGLGLEQAEQELPALLWRVQVGQVQGVGVRRAWREPGTTTCSLLSWQPLQK